MKTVLVVDDNDSIRRGLSLILRQSGFRPFPASDGCEAIEVAEAVRPDAIVLDQSMPGMDGLAVLEHVRGLPGFGGVPVVMFSAAESPRVRQDAERLGAAFVSKGTSNWEDLVGHLRRVLPARRVPVTPPVEYAA